MKEEEKELAFSVLRIFSAAKEGYSIVYYTAREEALSACDLAKEDREVIAAYVFLAEGRLPPVNLKDYIAKWTRQP